MRSAYIYIVMGSKEPLAAFTVKHELETWMDGWRKLPGQGDVKVFRVTDYGQMVTEIEVP